MYENLIRKPPITRKQQPFSLCLDPIPVDERVAYIDSVCAALIESRFDHGKYEETELDLGWTLKSESTAFDRLFTDNPVAWYVGCLDADAFRASLDASIPDRSLTLETAPSLVLCPNRSAPNLGRGSPPEIPGTQSAEARA